MKGLKAFHLAGHPFDETVICYPQGLQSKSRGETIEAISVEDLWTCPKTKAVPKIVALNGTNPVHIRSAREIIDHYGSRRGLMVNRASGMAALISKRPMQVYDDDTLTLMRRVARPKGNTMMDAAEFAKSTWEEVGRDAFVAAWEREADSLPTVETTSLYLLTGLLLPIWTKITSQNERYYRTTPTGGSTMIGRALGEDQAAVLRARFMTEAPVTPQEMRAKAVGTSAPVALGQGLSLVRRRVAGDVRLEIEGADRDMLRHLKFLGFFTEIIAFQLRVFVPHGEGVNSLEILKKIMGGLDPTEKTEAA